MYQPVNLRIRIASLWFLSVSAIGFYAYILLKPEPRDHAVPIFPDRIEPSQSIRRGQDTFGLAMQIIRRHEGHRFQQSSEDRGGLTKYGISQRAYPHLRIENITWQQACTIYKKDYWKRYQLDRIRFPQIAVKVMDMTVNMGPNRVHKILKSALQHQDMGLNSKHMNLETIRAINQAEPMQLLQSLREESSAFYRRLASRDDSQSRFLKGWLKRARA